METFVASCPSISGIALLDVTVLNCAGSCSAEMVPGVAFNLHSPERHTFAGILVLWTSFQVVSRDGSISANRPHQPWSTQSYLCKGRTPRFPVSCALGFFGSEYFRLLITARIHFGFADDICQPAAMRAREDVPEGIPHAVTRRALNKLRIFGVAVRHLCMALA